MPHRTHNGNRTIRNRARDDFLVKIPQIFKRASATSYNQHLWLGQALSPGISSSPDRPGNPPLGSFPLNRGREKHNRQPRRPTGEDVFHILECRSGRRRHDSDDFGKPRQFLLPVLVEEPFLVELFLE